MRNRAMYNQSGCLDMTAYIALCRIQREEKERRRAQLASHQAIQRNQRNKIRVRRSSYGR